MTVLKSLLKNIYRSLLPAVVRDSPIVSRLKSKLLPHNWIYDAEFYERRIGGPAARSAGTICDSIVTEFAPKRVIDVGCGTGEMIEELRNRGCDVRGLEYSQAALDYCKTKSLIVSKFDIEKSHFHENGEFDVAITLEVAEHLPERVADRFVDILTQLAPVIVFTAARPGQEGLDHVNCQPPSYWKAKFQARGFEELVEITQRWSDRWRSAGVVEGYYHENLIVLRRNRQL